MITEVTMPSMGADMTEGTIVNWLKSEGDVLEKGDKIAEIETDKTVVEMETYTGGVLKKIIVTPPPIKRIIISFIISLFNFFIKPILTPLLNEVIFLLAF
ncbi:MAG: biotin/lipoyl-containing protein, partial [Dehalococcoidia bacterium]|nr:biotin/lipoyl-containing protein [Dehalococcoidia bacterium]